MISAGAPSRAKVQKVPRGDRAPRERGRGAHVEDRERPLPVVLPHGRQHLDHKGEVLDREGSGDDRLPRVLEDDVEALGVAHLHRHVLRDERGALRPDVLQRVRQDHETLQVLERGGPRLPSPVVEDPHGGGTGVEEERPAPQGRHAVPVAVVEVEPPRGLGERLLHELLGDEDPPLPQLAALVEHQLLDALILEVHPDLREELERAGVHLLSLAPQQEPQHRPWHAHPPQPT
jgi:hypothetical protein